MNSVAKQMEGFQLAELLEGFAEPKALEVVKGLGVTDLNIDSQRVASGSLFMACRGQVSHGLDFMDDAIARGAVAIAWESDSNRQPQANVPLIEVANLSCKLGDIAARFFADPSSVMYVTSVTGTNGKTSVAHFIARLNEIENEVRQISVPLPYAAELYLLRQHIDLLRRQVKEIDVDEREDGSQTV